MIKIRKIFLRLVVILCFISLFISKSYSQEQIYSLSLSDAIEYALKHNKKLLNAKDDVYKIKEQYKETRAQGLPQIDGSISYTTYFNYEMNIKFGQTSDNNQNNINYSLLDAGDQEVLKTISSMFGSSKPIIMSDQFSGKVQLSQLIFSGQYMVGLQIAKIVDKIANQNLVLNELDVKESVINSYYSILVTQQTLQIINENINNLNELLKHKTNLYKAGAAEEIDVDQLTMTINQLKNNQNSLERAIEIGYNILKFQLGVPPDTKIELSDNINQIIDNIDYEILVNKDFQVSDNVNYQLMQSQVNLKEKQLGLQNWSYAPTIAGFYSYTKKIKTTGFDMTPNHLAGLNVSIPIFSSGLRKARVSQAKIDLDVSRRNIELVKEQLETQHKQLLFNYYNALENFKTQQENIIIAKKVLNNIENKYRQGLISSLEFVQANSNYLNAQSNYINATLTLLQAKTALNKLYNKL